MRIGKANTMDKPLVTVIVAAYNAANYLEETLHTILDQDYSPLEIIVVDDGSTDETAAIAKSFGNRVRYRYQQNSGSCASPRNHGLAAAQGEYVTFFDADDLMLPGKISRQVNELVTHSEAVLCVGNYRNFTGETTSGDHFSTCPELSRYVATSCNSSFVLEAHECRNILISENFTIASSPLFRTRTVVSEGGFNTDLKACEDFHLIYRTATHGKVVIVPEVLFERRLHDTNMSADSERMLRNLIASRLSLAQHETDPVLVKHLEKRAQRYRRSLQSCLINKGQFGGAFALYKDTLPPRSLSDLNHDIRQAIKLVFSQTRLHS